MTFLAFQNRKWPAGGGGGITGHDTVITGLSDGTERTAYNAWTIPGIAIGDLVYVPVHALGNASIQDPSTWTATLDGASMTRQAVSAATGSGQFPASALFWLIATSAGTLALNINLVTGARGCIATPRLIKGFDPAAPFVNQGAPSSLAADVSTFDIPPGGHTTAADGNVFLADINIKSGAVSAFTMSNLDGVSSQNTGTSGFTDLTAGWGHKTVTPAGSITGNAAWSSANTRVSTIFAEIKKAP